MKCPNCQKDRKFRPASFKRTVHIAPMRFVVEMPAQRCPSCKTFVVTEAAAQDAETEIARNLAESGPISAASFRLLRSAARLKSVELARLLDVGKETISRWESGKRRVDPLAWKILAWIAVERGNGEATTRHRLDRFLLARPRAGTIRLAAAVRQESVMIEATDVAETAAEEAQAYVLRDD